MYVLYTKLIALPVRLALLAHIGWLSFGLVSAVQAQNARINQYHLEAGSLLSTDQTPFWLRANQYGIVPLKGPVVRLQGGIRSDYRLADSSGHRPKVDWGYAVDAVANVGVTNQIILPEAHVKGRLGAFELYVGRKREIVGLVDTLLTSGAYAWSGNTLPLPKIQIGLYQYTPIPFTKGILSVLGAYSHGWFENGDRLVKGSYLHQKYLYGRIGKPTWPFRLYGGFNHEVIWGGQAAPGVLSDLIAVNGKLPSSIQYYLPMVLGLRGQGDRNDPNVTSLEDNRIGNHLGSVDLGADVNLRNWNLYVYRQFLYDDGSLFYGTNLADGLNGLRIKNRRQSAGEPFFLQQITLEYLFTESQGGDDFVIDDPELRGRDNYFNHSQFIDGWTYFGRTIGTPFLTPTAEARPTLPSSIGIVNNRVSMVHLGGSALLSGKIQVITRLSFSRNLGTYPYPYPDAPTQFSGLLTAAVPVRAFGGTMLSSSLGLDLGGLLPNSVGVYVGLRKTGLLSRGNNQTLTPR
ncbi:capsule assembly Wzi family protein [uncultured Fibrella sp.]|uniref:capsule assembly Wzi family protein n=1 Tax=uncultured Fibrella sp. TaxID=1284596 RepID=UPI0035CC41FA